MCKGDCGAGHEGAGVDHEAVDRAIRRLAVRKGEYTLEEGRWLLAAREQKVHLRFGFATLTEYIERRLGYARRSTLERLRVAEALLELPALKAALGSGARSWSAVREITRVAVPKTEARWLAATERKIPHEVQRMVTGRRRGDEPDAPRDPQLVPRVVRLELPPEAYARYREAIDRVKKEVDPHLTEAQIFDTILHRVLGRPNDEGRAPYQIALTVCEDCGRASQKGGDQEVDVDEVVVEQAQCDAQHIGRVDRAEGPRSGRASQTIPPAIRRKVLRRDRGRCRVPGCRNTLWLDVHHVLLRAEGGRNDPENLVCLCATHHALTHRGWLTVEGGMTTGLTFQHTDGSLYGGATDSAAIGVAQEAFAGLRSLGILDTRARALIASAQKQVGVEASAGALLEHAIRHQGSVLPSAGRCDPDEDILCGLRSLGFSAARSEVLLGEARAQVGTEASTGALLEYALKVSRGRGASVVREPPAPPYRRTPIMQASASQCPAAPLTPRSDCSVPAYSVVDAGGGFCTRTAILGVASSIARAADRDPRRCPRVERLGRGDSAPDQYGSRYRFA